MLEDNAEPEPMRVDPSHEPVARRVVESFRRRFGQEPELLVRSPGRVALLGAHIDYSDGWVMPAAIDRAVWLAVSPLDAVPMKARFSKSFEGMAISDARVSPGRSIASGDPPSSSEAASSVLVALDFEEEARIGLGAPPSPLSQRREGDPSFRTEVHWSDYPAAMAWALAQRGRNVPELAAVYGSDLPVGAGVSSSAAVEMAFFLAFRELTRVRTSTGLQRMGQSTTEEGAGLDRRAGAELGRMAENEYLGVQSGVMDQFACLHGREDHLIFLDCRTLEYRTLEVPSSAGVLVFDSGVRRRLAESGFNDRRAQCSEAVEILRRYLPRIRALRDVSSVDLDRFGHRLPAELLRRARHAVEECARVRSAAQDLEEGNLAAFGKTMVASHASSRDLYEVSLPELDALSDVASASEGCWGAKIMGGGFGGCVAALVEIDAMPGIVEGVSEAFEKAFGYRPPSFSTRLANGARLCDW